MNISPQDFRFSQFLICTACFASLAIVHWNFIPLDNLLYRQIGILWYWPTLLWKHTGRKASTVGFARKCFFHFCENQAKIGTFLRKFANFIFQTKLLQELVTHYYCSTINSKGQKKNNFQNNNHSQLQISKTTKVNKNLKFLISRGQKCLKIFVFYEIFWKNENINFRQNFAKMRNKNVSCKP